MKKKKILMFFLLILFIVILGFIVFKINTKSLKLNSENEKIEKNREEEVIEIKDDSFIATTNDVYYKLDSYIGKTIKMEGFIYNYEAYGDTRYAVVRNSPGCCGNDGLAGLDIKYDGEMPKAKTWVEIVGVVEEDELEKNYSVPILKIKSMVEKEEGVTFVNK